jgi:hypothetical protein
MKLTLCSSFTARLIPGVAMIDIANGCAKKTDKSGLGRKRCVNHPYFLICPQGKSEGVRPRWRLISMVQVHVGASHISVAEGNCATARWGGKQPKANPRAGGGRTRFGGVSRRAYTLSGEGCNTWVTRSGRLKR